MKGQTAMSAARKMSSFIGILLCLSGVVCLAITNRTVRVAAASDRQQTSVVSSRPAVNSLLSWRSSNTASNIVAPPQGAQSEKTVDQARKNIQMLKGLPESQLFLVMNFVASSLGEQCNFCHVQQGKDPKTGFTKWVWESDDKPEKQTARRMMQMVLSIKANNKVDFRENEVTCYTCHRGQRQPVGLPPMPLARSGHEPGPNNAVPSVRTTSPSVEQIFSKYIEAVGGNVVTTTKTLVLKGKREASQDRNWANEITLASPDKFLIVATTPQATVRQIVNGDNGWIVNGTNVRSLAPAEAVEARRSWDELFNIVKVKPSHSMRL